MSAERTLAVQAELAGRPDVSVALFDRTYGKRNEPLKASVSSIQYHLASLAPSGEEGKALMALTSLKELEWLRLSDEPLYAVMYEIPFIVRETPEHVRIAERWQVPNKLTHRSGI